MRDMRHACKERPSRRDFDTVRAPAFVVNGAHAACRQLIASLPDRGHVIRHAGHDLHVRGIHLPAVHISHGKVIHAPEEIVVGEPHRVCEVLAFSGGLRYLRGNELLELCVFFQRNSRALVDSEHFAVELIGLRRSLPDQPVYFRSGTAVNLGDFRGDLVRGKPQTFRAVELVFRRVGYLRTLCNAPGYVPQNKFGELVVEVCQLLRKILKLFRSEHLLTSEQFGHGRYHFQRPFNWDAVIPRNKELRFEQSRLNHLEAAVKLSASVLEHAVAELYCALAVLAVNAVEPC